jgi:hypothetical protein
MAGGIDKSTDPAFDGATATSIDCDGARSS